MNCKGTRNVEIGHPVQYFHHLLGLLPDRCRTDYVPKTYVLLKVVLLMRKATKIFKIGYSFN